MELFSIIKLPQYYGAERGIFMTLISELKISNIFIQQAFIQANKHGLQGDMPYTNFLLPFINFLLLLANLACYLWVMI